MRKLWIFWTGRCTAGASCGRPTRWQQRKGEGQGAQCSMTAFPTDLYSCKGQSCKPGRSGGLRFLQICNDRIDCSDYC